MQNLQNLNGKKRFFTKKKIIAIFIVIIILITVFYLYFYYSSIYWDGGKWESITTIPSNDKNYSEPTFIEYNGLLYGFFSFVSKSTYSRSDPITPDEYSLKDIVYRTFDGKNWGPENIISNTNDETSESIRDAVIYNDRIYISRYKSTREVIGDDETDWDNIVWNSSIVLQSFDGKEFFNYGPIILPNETGERCGSPNLMVWENKIWAIWKSNVYYEYNHYNFKYFDGKNWSDMKGFAIPSSNANDIVFCVYDNSIWATWWCSVSQQISDTDIYLGKFNGESMEFIAVMTDEGKNPLACRPYISGYNGKIYVTWEGEGITCRAYSNGKIDKAMYVDSGMEVFTIVYKNKLYVLFQSYRSMSGDPDFFIKAYNGNTWSDSYQITSSSYPGSDYPKAFTFDGKLYTYWESRLGSNCKIAIKEYKK